MAREFPGRVVLILIRQVGGDDEDRNIAVRERAAALREEGILHLVPDAVAATDLACAAGLCDSETVTEVREEVGR